MKKYSTINLVKRLIKEQIRLNEENYLPLTRNVYNKLRKIEDKISSKSFDILLTRYNINPNDYYAGNLSDKVDPITKNPKYKFKKSSSQQEIDDLAISLIDYLGGQLPNQGYTRNQRIMDYFRELGYKDNDPMIHKIYNRALQLNRK